MPGKPFIVHRPTSQGAVDPHQAACSRRSTPTPRCAPCSLSAVPARAATVQVPHPGARSGGNLPATLPAVHRAGPSSGCVIAYSSFSRTPAARTTFLRPSRVRGVELAVSGQYRGHRTGRSACVNPAAVGGGRRRRCSRTSPSVERGRHEPPAGSPTRGLYTAALQDRREHHVAAGDRRGRPVRPQAGHPGHGSRPPSACTATT